jgi:DNA-directed RNA polymerase sigma subunit (sigma70/sigma32)
LKASEKEIIDKVIATQNQTGKTGGSLTESQKAILDSVRLALEELTPKQHQVIDLIFGLTTKVPLSERDTAKKMGITHQSAHGLKDRAIKHLQRICQKNDSVLKSIRSS